MRMSTIVGGWGSSVGLWHDYVSLFVPHEAKQPRMIEVAYGRPLALNLKRGPHKFPHSVGVKAGSSSVNCFISIARVAKSADAKDLKSFSPQGECGFKSHPGHQPTPPQTPSSASPACPPSRSP